MGIAALFLGIIIPVLHHVLLHLPLASQQTNNIATRMHGIYHGIHWTEWVYLAVMGVTGVGLILSGAIGLLSGAPSTHNSK